MNQVKYNTETKKWELTLEADLMIRAKRIFPGAAGQFGSIQLSDTLENVEDLQWFLSRWDLPLDDGGYLQDRVMGAKRREALRVGVLSGGYTPPATMESKVPLREYQQKAVAQLSAMKRVLLADDLGLGKSISCIGGFALPGALPALVLTQTALVYQWEREIRRCFPDLKTHILKTKKPYDLTLQQGRVRSKTPKPFPDVVITSYSKISEWADVLREKIRYVICDECQELRTGTAPSVPLKYNAVRSVSLAAEYAMFASATPIYNYGGEFYAVLDALSPGVLGTLPEFGLAWCGNTYANTAKILHPRTFGRHLIESGTMLRRTRDQVGRELPACQEMLHEVDTDQEVLAEVEADCRALATRLLSDTKLGQGEARDAARDFDMRLRQATGLAKAPYVAAFVRMLVEQGESVVLYGWHRQVYEVWLKKLEDLQPALYTGTESPLQKEESKRRFVSGETKVLIMSLRSGAGLDGLQHVCRTGVFGELDYSKGVHGQCGGRLHRDGQRYPVFLYYLNSGDGSDPPMMDLLGIKSGQLEGTINPDADFVSSLEVDEGRVRAMAERYLKSRSVE